MFYEHTTIVLMLYFITISFISMQVLLVSVSFICNSRSCENDAANANGNVELIRFSIHH